MIEETATESISAITTNTPLLVVAILTGFLDSLVIPGGFNYCHKNLWLVVEYQANSVWKPNGVIFFMRHMIRTIAIAPLLDVSL